MVSIDASRPIVESEPEVLLNTTRPCGSLSWIFPSQLATPMRPTTGGEQALSGAPVSYVPPSPQTQRYNLGTTRHQHWSKQVHLVLSSGTPQAWPALTFANMPEQVNGQSAVSAISTPSQASRMPWLTSATWNNSVLKPTRCTNGQGWLQNGSMMHVKWRTTILRAFWKACPRLTTWMHGQGLSLLQHRQWDQGHRCREWHHLRSSLKWPKCRRRKWNQHQCPGQQVHLHFFSKPTTSVQSAFSTTTESSRSAVTRLDAVGPFWKRPLKPKPPKTLFFLLTLNLWATPPFLRKICDPKQENNKKRQHQLKDKEWSRNKTTRRTTRSNRINITSTRNASRCTPIRGRRGNHKRFS